MAQQDFGDGVELLGVENAARGVLRRVENQQTGLRRDLRFELGGVECKTPALVQINRYRHGAIRNDLRFVDRESGHRINHFVADAVIGYRRDRISDERLGASGNHDIFWRYLESTTYAHVVCCGGAQFIDTR